MKEDFPEKLLNRLLRAIRKNLSLKRKPRGLTLIELLITAALAAFLFAGILLSIQTGMRSAAVNRHRCEAAIIGQRTLENMKGMDFALIPAQAHDYAVNGVLGETRITVETVTEGLRVAAYVRWADFNQSYTEVVASLVKDPNL